MNKEEKNLLNYLENVGDEKAKDAPRIWILKTPGGEFIEFDEPMNYDWTLCSKKEFIGLSAYQELEAKLAFTEEKLKQTQATVLETIKFRDEALAKLDIAVEALKYSSHQYSDGVYDLPLLALEALQELGEA